MSSTDPKPTLGGGGEISETFYLDEPGHGTIGDAAEVYMTPKLSHRIYAPHEHTAAQTLDARGASFADMLRVSRATTACYSVGHFLNDAAASLWFSYLLYYLQNAQKLSKLDAGVVLFSGQLFDAIATPTVGLLSDRSKGWPALGLGRRKLWNLIGVIIVVICFSFVFGTCLPCDLNTGLDHSGGEWAAVKTASFAVFASLFNVGWAAVQVSHMAMVPELTHDEGERVMLNTARYAFTILANVMVFVTMALVLRLYDGGAKNNSDNPAVYSIVTYVVLAVGGLMSVIFLVGTREVLVSLDSSDRVHLSTGKTPAAAESVVDVHPAVLAPAKVVDGGVGADNQSSELHIHPSTSAADAFIADKRPSERDGLLSGTGGTHLESLNVDAPYNNEEGPSAAAGSIVPSGVGSEMHISSFRRHPHMTWRDWLRVTEFYKVGGVYMFTRLATNVSQVYISFFVTTTLQMPQTSIALVPLVLYLAQLVATFVLKRVASTLGRRYSMLLGAVLFGSACAAMLFIPLAEAWLVYPTMVLLGAGSAVITVISVSMEADLVGRNVESGAFVYGAMSLTDKLSNGAAILVIQYAVPLSSARFVRIVNALVPLVCVTLATVVAFSIPFPARLQGSQSFRDLKRRLQGGIEGRSTPVVDSIGGSPSRNRVDIDQYESAVSRSQTEPLLSSS